MAGTFLHQSSWYSNPWAVEFAERLGRDHARRSQGRELRRDGLGGQRDRHAHGARRDRQVRHRLHDPRPAWRQPRGGGADQRRRQPPQEPRAADVPGQGERAAAALLLSLPRQQHLSRLRHRLPQVERGDAGVRHQPEHRRHHGRDDPRARRHDRAAEGMAAAACRSGQALGCAADPRRMPARAGPHGQDVGDGALRRDARHRHLRQGAVRRARHLRHHHHAADRRAGARRRRPAVGGHLLERSAGCRRSP